MAIITLSASKDNYIQSSSTTTNNGTQTNITCQSSPNIERGLIYFDLSSINGTLNSATLKVYGRTLFVNPSTVGVYRMTRDWGETTSNWNTYDGSNNWTSAGGDFNSTLIASQAFSTIGNFEQDITSLVDDWLDGTYNNYGIMFKIVNEAVNQSIRFESREGSDAPELIVNYNPRGGTLFYQQI